jgi:hypothetical protein
MKSLQPSARPLVTNMAGASAMLNKSRDKVYELIKGGQLESYLDGDVRRVTIRSIENFVERRVSESKEFQRAYYPKPRIVNNEGA